MRNLEAELDQLRAEQVEALTVTDRDRLMMLGRDLTQAWDSPGATAEIAQEKIIRTVITEIVVDVVGDSLESFSFIGKEEITRMPWCEEEQVRPHAMGHRHGYCRPRARLGSSHARSRDRHGAQSVGKNDDPRPQLDPRQRSARCAITTTAVAIHRPRGAG